MTLVYDATGAALRSTTATDANSAVTLKNKALNPDRSMASETISGTSPDGKSRPLSRDVDGDAVIDHCQTETTVVNGDGSKVATLIDKTGGGSISTRSSQSKKFPLYFPESRLTAKAPPLLFPSLYAMPAPFSGGIAGRSA